MSKELGDRPNNVTITSNKKPKVTLNKDDDGKILFL